jgi:YVTN family beta-propeller protein
VIDTASNQVIDAIAVNHSPGRVAFTPDGELAYVTNYRSHNVSVIDARSHDVVATVPVAGRATNVAFSPDGALAYITTLGGRINVIETIAHSLVANIGVGIQPYAIAMLASGDRAYTADLRSNTSTIIDTVEQGAGDAIIVGTSPFAVAVRCVAANCAAPPLTPRPTRTATPSATITPTLRPSSTPRPTRSTPTPLVIISIGSARAVGDSAVIEVRLDGGRVGGFRTISFDNTILALGRTIASSTPRSIFRLAGETSV